MIYDNCGNGALKGELYGDGYGLGLWYWSSVRSPGKRSDVHAYRFLDGGNEELYGIFGAIRAECFLTVTGARLPFTALTRVQIRSGTPRVAARTIRSPSLCRPIWGRPSFG